MSSFTSMLESQWLFIVAAGVVLLSLLIALLALLAVARLRKVVEDLQAVEAKALRQRQLMQESLQGLGRRLMQQDELILRQGRSANQPNEGSPDGSQQVVAMLEAGHTVDEIASETGLEEVEVALLQQIYSLSRQVDAGAERAQ